jgi:hypothetical protein
LSEVEVTVATARRFVTAYQRLRDLVDLGRSMRLVVATMTARCSIC